MNTASQPPVNPEVAAFLQQKHRPFIGGKFIDSDARGEIAVIDPATGQTIASVPDCGTEAVDHAVRISFSVWTRDLNKAFQVSKALKAGTVWINSHNAVDANAPFGGYKQSGMGREHGRAVLDSYLETKTIVARYA